MPNSNLVASKKCKMTANRMAQQRTLMATDRTLLAWVRTAMSFISFGFTLAKILGSVAENLKSKIMSTEGDHVGLFLIVMGTVPLILAMYQYYRVVKNITGSCNGILIRPSFILALFILMLSVVLFFNIFFNLEIP